VRLDGTSYVGRAQCGDVAVELAEKIDGALAALLRFATYGAFRVEQLPAPVSDLGKLAVLLIREFLQSARAYASLGREFEYRREPDVGSLVGGRIDPTRTLLLRARGWRHLVAFDRNVLAYNTLLNRVVFAAVRQVEPLAKILPLTRGDVAKARGLAHFFSDCRDAEVLFGSRQSFVRYAQTLLNQPRPDRQRDLLALASVVLSHESFELDSKDSTSVPRSWFLNLETLFEAAVGRVLQMLASSSRVYRQPTPKPPIFELVQDEHRAEPDLLVRSNAEGVMAVGDVKYKDWSGAPAAADLYQLLVHAATYDAALGFLIYPHDRYEFRHLGESSTGCDTWLFAGDVRDLRSSLKAAAAEMKLSL
jgi:5-methylcytosine-specific restriction endonuclease McrBC regulatory subunit McrC